MNDNNNLINYLIIAYVVYIVYIVNIGVSLGIGDWGLGIGPNPQSPIPNPHFIYVCLQLILNELITYIKYNYLNVCKILTNCQSII